MVSRKGPSTRQERRLTAAPFDSPGTCARSGHHSTCQWPAMSESNGAEERTRTFTVLLPPAPQAGASANSATSASGGRSEDPPYNVQGAPIRDSGSRIHDRGFGIQD